MMATFFFLLRALIHNKAGVVPAIIEPQIVMDLFRVFWGGAEMGAVFLLSHIYKGPSIYSLIFTLNTCKQYYNEYV